MTYKQYRQIKYDILYGNNLINEDNKNIYIARSNHNQDLKKLKKEWEDYVEEKFNQTTKSNTKLGKFLQQNPLTFVEMQILIELLDHRYEQDPFEKYKKNYRYSLLKKNKLVYCIKDPRRPMSEEYVVSYKCQLMLLGKPYTDEYEQLDMALEEQSTKKGIDAIETLYYTIKPKQKLKDLVVSNETRKKIETAIIRSKNQSRANNHWGLHKIGYGIGVTINFRGEPGTGKTLAAHCIANELKKELLIVRYDQVQNAYIGETEKHIQQVFKLAKIKNAVLFFDEADALAVDRSTLQRSWEMSQVNTLIKELERFEGTCIFATNFAEKYDKAFERRLTMHIDFPKPKKEQAQIILHKLLPPRMRHQNLNLKELKLEGLTGGLLKNVVLNAIGFAELEGKNLIEKEHIEDALKMIQQKGEQEDKKNLSYIG